MIPLLLAPTRPCRSSIGQGWRVDQHLKVAETCPDVCPTISQFGRRLDVAVSQKRVLTASRRLFGRALAHGQSQTHGAPASPQVLGEALPTAQHVNAQYAHNPIDADRGRLNSRLRPTRRLHTDRGTMVVTTAPGPIDNFGCGHAEFGGQGTPDAAGYSYLQ